MTIALFSGFNIWFCCFRSIWVLFLVLLPCLEQSGFELWEICRFIVFLVELFKASLAWVIIYTVFTYCLSNCLEILKVYVCCYEYALVKTEHISAARCHDVKEFLRLICSFFRTYLCEILHRESGGEDHLLSKLLFEELWICICEGEE